MLNKIFNIKQFINLKIAIFIFIFIIFTYFSVNKIFGAVISTTQYNLIYTSSNDKNDVIVKNVISKGLITSSIKNKLDIDSNFNSNNLFISPNHKYIAVSVNDFNPYSYLIDTSGNKVTQLFGGSFCSWSPDSNEILIYVSGDGDANGRKIYSLDLNNNYVDIGLPYGVIDASYLADGKSIVYSLTKGGSDSSEIWIRDKNKKDKFIYSSDDHSVLAWLRPSSTTSQIAFIRDDIKIRGSVGNELWVINNDSSDAHKVASNIAWDYPPIWSPDYSKLLFTVQENSIENAELNNFKNLESNIWEFNTGFNSLTKITNFSNKRIVHPNYLSDGNDIVFISNQSGFDEVWIKDKNNIQQITNDKTSNRYPINF